MEVTAQILDALAFVLVTPEFLGEQTLSSIRDYLDIIAHLIRKTVLRKNIMILVGIFVVITPVLTAVAVVFWIFVRPAVGDTDLTPSALLEIALGALDFTLPVTFSIAAVLFPIVGIVLLLILIAYIVVVIATRLVVRRIMFSIGVVLFFLARGISVWHAW